MAVALALLVGLCDAIQTANGKTPTGRMHRWGSDASCRLSGDDIDGDAFIQQSGGSVSAAYLQTALGKAQRITEAANAASTAAHAVATAAHTATGWNLMDEMHTHHLATKVNYVPPKEKGKK
ncbi:unnamed protein product [Vitrella brassicaformis CCMP3155]|uniref:VAN3-binding protein-like auxin canalisation domain-containing protein n=1 Tax=Vitrella brassicaformis (strain CCMP3155) TaxID=1169540 RepID=A0A0G4FB68_VITBC|nr:unnamed protein product [Vitrella brassicaformis CCMP3155]|eukprot:CEM09889.1 unnamed protein product [Vitrella brassicaformis CCMP3155]